MKFSTLASYFQTIENTSSRISMTKILADVFHQVSQDEIGAICYLLQGRVAASFSSIEFGIADKFMIRAIARAFRVLPSVVTQEFRKTGDLGATAEHIALGGEKESGISRQDMLVGLEKSNTLPPPTSVLEVFMVLTSITALSGIGSQDKKVEILSELLAFVTPLEARYLVRIPLGKLRLGFSDMTILDGLSWMISEDKRNRAALEDAFNVRPDIGFIARTVKESGVDGLKKVHAVVGAPILPALCQRIPTTEEMIEKMGTVCAEPKFDGVRTQIHFRRSKSEKLKHTTPDSIDCFSRNLENTSQMYPELLAIGNQIHADNAIFDAEAVGYDEKTGKLVAFQETVTRKRKHDIVQTSRTMPLRFYIFDILCKDDVDLMPLPLSKRRKILKDTIDEGGALRITDAIVTDDPTVLRQYHTTQREAGLEGIVVKQWDGPYEPGRKGFRWVKLKEGEGKTGKLTDTVDCVIMGYSQGEGKRSGFGIGAFLVGIRNKDTFQTITKIGTGVSDDLWKTLAGRLSALITKEKPKEYTDVVSSLIPDYWIIPEVVVEIAADDLTVSPVHGAGFALRFPRLVKIREDKSPKDVTTREEIERMYTNQDIFVS